MESLAVPAFSSPIDCTPWVTGGLWPAELSTTDLETSTLAEYLKVDLERIARSANDELKVLRRSGLSDAARRSEESRIIDEARARAERRVESTIRQLHAAQAQPDVERPTPRVADFGGRPDLETTQVIPAIRGVNTTVAAPVEDAPERRWRDVPSRRQTAESAEASRDSGPAAAPIPPIDDTQVIPVVTEAVEAEGAEPQIAKGEPSAAAMAAAPQDTGKESDVDRLNRLLEFVVRQESRLNWAVGHHLDGTTVVVTDLAHGWIPPGISLPEGVRLLDPARRSGKPSALVGDTTRVATYAPGDSLRRSADLGATKSSLRPRELPAVDDLGAVLSTATHWRDGLPRMVHTMASAAAAGTLIVDQEVDVLRVQLDTARYQLLVQYPDVDSALLLNCLLLAATEAFVVGDPVSANYHLRWFQRLDEAQSS